MIEENKNNPLYGDETRMILTSDYKGLTYSIITFGTHLGGIMPIGVLCSILNII